MKKYGKVSKATLITIIIIVCIVVIGIAAVIGVMFFDKVNKTRQEKILSDEIVSMYNSQNIESQIKTTGKFSIVEKALKNYYTEFKNVNNNLMDIYSQNLLNNCLTANNISTDGPDFNSTKANINKIKDIENTTNLKYEDMSSDEYINSISNNLKLDKYYTNLFITQLNDNLKIKEDVEKIKDVTESYDKWITQIENVLNFLNENKENWKVSGTNILFTSNDLVTQYNNLLTDLKNQESLLAIKLNTTKF